MIQVDCDTGLDKLRYSCRYFQGKTIMQIDVLCVGHAAYDLSLIVDSYPPENSKCETEVWLEDCGGPASNAAFLLSKWNVACAFSGLVGDDLYGRRIADAFRLVGTDISKLQVRPGHVTPLSVILVNKGNGSRTIINRTRKDVTFQVDFGDWGDHRPRVLLFDGHALEASLSALESFPDAVSILDAGSWRKGTATLAEKVDYLAASERFALQATGVTDLQNSDRRRQALSWLRDRFDTTVIVTLGENGLIADDGGGFVHLPAFPAETVDSTAAGDIFHGALAFAVCESMQLPESLRFASSAAALSVQDYGGRASIPTLDRVRQAMHRF
jgi:sulfofructose kinase